MSLRQLDFSRQGERLQVYLDGLTEAAGHADRVVPIENYTKGLMLPIERKSIEPMAARLAPGNVRQMHQSLHHVVADAAWSDDALLKQVRSQVLPAMTRKHALAAWIVDDTGFPKKGTHSVGVARQYCGQLGKQDNCRVAVSVSLATEEASIPAAYRLYLPEVWANDKERRQEAGVPKVRWLTKMYHAVWFLLTPPTATIVDFAKDSYHWGFAMRLASSPRPRFGPRASCRCRPGRREKWAVRRGYCGGMNNISHSLRKTLLYA
jgi:SRSO17 transposase